MKTVIELTEERVTVIHKYIDSCKVNAKEKRAEKNAAKMCGNIDCNQSLIGGLVTKG